jgi:hypothetical protein
MMDAECAIATLERQILAALNNVPSAGWCRGLKPIEAMTGIPQEIVRATMRGLIDAGLAEYHRGLFTDDMETAGSGYCITEKGTRLVRPEVW